MVLVDLFLLTLLTTAQTTSLAISVAVVGWVYFPVRQWFWRRYVVRDRGELEAWLDAALPPMLSVRQEAELVPALRRTLTSVFEPLSSSVETTTAISPRSATTARPSWCRPGHAPGRLLEHAYGGARLFTRIDVATAQRVLALYAVVVRALHAQEEGAHTERERIRGTFTTTSGPSCDAAAPGRRQRACVGTRSHQGSARTARRARLPRSPRTALDQWRKEYEDRRRDAHVRLLWRENGHPGDVELSARAYHHVTRILREALERAAPCAAGGSACSPRPQRKRSRFWSRTTDTCRTPTARFAAAVLIMRQRAESLGGSVSRSRDGDFWQVRIALPLGCPCHGQHPRRSPSRRFYRHWPLAEVESAAAPERSLPCSYIAPLAAGLALLLVLVDVIVGAQQRSAFDADAFVAGGADFDVEIVRDGFGVPHIYGERDADVAFGLAWAQAEDDIATIEEIIPSSGRVGTIPVSRPPRGLSDPMARRTRGSRGQLRDGPSPLTFVRSRPTRRV